MHVCVYNLFPLPPQINISKYPPSVLSPASFLPHILQVFPVPSAFPRGFSTNRIFPLSPKPRPPKHPRPIHYFLYSLRPSLQPPALSPSHLRSRPCPSSDLTLPSENPFRRQMRQAVWKQERNFGLREPSSKR